MRTISISKPSDIRNHLQNMAAVIAEAMLKEHGEYRCVIGGEKVEVKIK